MTFKPTLPTDSFLPVTCPSCAARCVRLHDLRRFLRRHPKLCAERAAFTKQLAAGTRSVDGDAWRERERVDEEEHDV